MVTMPEATTFATEDPEMVPNSAPEATAALAGPPRAQPNSELHRSLMYSPTPETCRKAAKHTNRMMYDDETWVVTPNMPYSLYM
jgi:hypothetical protein